MKLIIQATVALQDMSDIHRATHEKMTGEEWPRHLFLQHCPYVNFETVEIQAEPSKT